MPISDVEHWLVIWGLSQLLTIGFVLDSGTKFFIARRDHARNAALHNGGQAVAGIVWFVMCSIAVWLGDLAITENPSIRHRLVPGLTAMGYAYLVGMVILWIIRNVIYQSPLVVWFLDLFRRGK